MNIEQLVLDIKALVAASTGYQEHSPRITERQQPLEGSPNSGVFRVVVMATGKTKQAGLNRYADLAVVTSAPMSGGDANRTNLDTAIQAESLIDILADYDAEDAQTQEEVEATITREAGRSVVTYTVRVGYKLTEE